MVRVCVLIMMLGCGSTVEPPSTKDVAKHAKRLDQDVEDFTKEVEEMVRKREERRKREEAKRHE